MTPHPPSDAMPPSGRIWVKPAITATPVEHLEADAQSGIPPGQEAVMDVMGGCELC